MWQQVVQRSWLHSFYYMQLIYFSGLISPRKSILSKFFLSYNNVVFHLLQLLPDIYNFLQVQDH